MVKEEQSMYHKMRSLINNVVDQDYFKSEDEWKNITELTEKNEFRFLLGHLPCIVSIFNIQKGYYEFISDSMKSILGYDPRVFEGEKGVNLIFDAVMKEHAGVFFDTIMKEIFAYLFEHCNAANATDFRYTICAKLKASNGMLQWYLMDTKILQVNSQGKPLRTIFTMINVDRYKKDDGIYYDLLKRDEKGIYRPVLQNSISESRMFESLTEREYEILSFISKGYTSAQIAESLFISLFTVQTHRKNIKRKLRCKSNGELINYALARGII
jgi:DNA-binding CsgD family transcriptional regulator